MGESWLHDIVFIQITELCVTVGYMEFCVDRDLKRV